MIKWFRKKDKHQEEEPAPASTGETEAVDTDRETGPYRRPELNPIPQPDVEPAQIDDDGVQPSAAEPETMPAAVEADREEAPPGAGSEDAAKPPRKRFFNQLRERLKRTRSQLTGRVDRIVLGKKTIDDDLLDDLEEALITADLGVRTTTALLERVADKVRRKELTDPQKLKDQLRDELQAILDLDAQRLDPRSNRPFVIMVIGVNGVGKTTTIGKLANIFKQQGLETMLVAADTFRAAAIEQLLLWGKRIDVPVVHQKSGSDPSAVVFDALDSALARNVEVVIIDTAGRMHTKVNLMEELKKIRRVVRKKLPTAPHETLLVLDATTGQNALSQARMFQQELGVSGLVLTKLDGTAKGGIIVGICDELQIPVRFIGIGEGLEDLRAFDGAEFVNALF